MCGGAVLSALSAIELTESWFSKTLDGSPWTVIRGKGMLKSFLTSKTQAQRR